MSETAPLYQSERKQVYFSEEKDTELEEAGFNVKRHYKILKHLDSIPSSMADIMQTVKISRSTAIKYLNYLVDSGEVEKIASEKGSMIYYAIAGKQYKIDLEKGPIERIPKLYFYDIPIIKKWFTQKINDPDHLRYIAAFLKICYGEVAKEFRINPNLWKHPDSTEKFYLEYKAEHKKELFQYQIDSIRAFYSVCLGIQLTKGESEHLGLAPVQEKGKYKTAKLTKEEIEFCTNWIESSEECRELAKIEGIELDRLKAHWAFSLESFGRPSMILVILTKAVEPYQYEFQGQKGTLLKWFMYESKQKDQYPKLMIDQRLVGWARAWLAKRYPHYRYLFLDDNEYEIKQYDTEELRDERERYSRIYKAMFAHLNKEERIFQDDVLYCLRHAGVQLWIERLGIEALPVISMMGWSRLDVLMMYYGSVRPTDIFNYIIHERSSGLAGSILKHLGAGS